MSVRPAPFLCVGFSLLLAACGGGDGTVVDAATGRPVAGAILTITDAGIGRRDGQLVVDAAHSQSATTGANGQFRFLSGASGYSLVVEAQGYPPIQSSVPTRWPTVVRVGGPFGAAIVMMSLPLANGLGWRFGATPGVASRSQADLWIDPPPDLDGGPPVATFHAQRGLTFVAGVGQPPTPPANGFVSVLPVDLTESGWLFVKAADGSSPAIATGSYGRRLDDGAGDLLTLDYRTIEGTLTHP